MNEYIESCQREKRTYDEEGVREAVRLFLKSIGEDPEREGLVETPDRIARACRELFAGLQASPADVMHEDIDISLHLMGKDLKTVYSPRMIAAMSARRMDTSLSSFLSYMRRFKNTFDAHPQHTRTHKPEVLFTAMYPAMHMFYPVWQKVLNSADINPAEAAWINEQMELAEAQGKQLYDETPTDEVYDEKHEK